MDLDELENEDWGNDDVVSTECNLVNPFAWDGAAKESYLGMVVRSGSVVWGFSVWVANLWVEPARLFGRLCWWGANSCGHVC